MEAKGIGVASLPRYVKHKFSARYQEWVDSLPERSKYLLINDIDEDSWYPLNESLVIPTKLICELFYKGSPKGAWEAGRFSADEVLNGIYRGFLKSGSPHFIIKRANQIFTQYYKPVMMSIAELEKNRVIMHITSFPEASIYIEHRIAGWMEKALELSGCRLNLAKIHKSLARGDKYTEYEFGWN